MLLQFKIQLAKISKPPVWRRVLVPSGYSFYKFHNVIQQAFGWYNYHLFMFSPRGYGSYPSIGIPSNEYDDEVTNCEKIKLSDIFTQVGQKFNYTYDFGDDWIHKIVVEKIVAIESPHPELLAGKGACPPEDCGGPWGYLNLQEIMNSPMHPERKEMTAWLGLNKDAAWDEHFFNFENARKNVAKI